VRVLQTGVLNVGLGAAFAASAGPAWAEHGELPRPREAIFTQGEAGPTRAWTAFCKKHPSECAVNRSEAATVSLTPETWVLIKAVNTRINREIIPVTDQEHWGSEDRWDFPDDGKGDCEDIQILKRRILAEAGLPRRAMRMAVVVDEDGAGHAVLLLLTDRGDFVLDNKTDGVLLWQQTAYTFVKREGTESAKWVSLGNKQPPLVTAGR
jgi:predicted transglutaminase-like cysteine proteinase